MSRWLISVDELAGSYLQPGTVVADCRFALQDAGLGERQYALGHIPGSRYLHLDRDLSSPKQEHGGRHPLPDAAQFERALRACGVNDDTLVVAYDDSRGAFAARLWWLLRYFGHDRVRVLDGGYRAWCEAGLPVATDVAPSAAGAFTARARPELLVDRDAVIGLRGAPDHLLVDSREPPRYLGLEEPIDPHAGHIEGARNHPWQEVTDERGYFKAADAQRARWGDALATDDIVVYCGSGVTACVNLLALAELGRDDARLYAGSWSDWCSYF
jgi:thiosulfate/3-mercaptopyruvate sulfurtransferase